MVFRVAGTGLILALFFFVSPASADELYRLLGSDRLQVGNSLVATTISYDGIEHLRITRSEDLGQRIIVDAKYRVISGHHGQTQTAHAEAPLNNDPDGPASLAGDPAYLTPLTQPFAPLLDVATLMQIEHLHNETPFTSVSNVTGTALRGYLRHGRDGFIAGTPVVAMDFSADGPIAGTLPNSQAVTLSGVVHMVGHAYYRHSDALLFGLETHLFIEGRIGGAEDGTRVNILYWRWLRALRAPARGSAFPKAS